MKYIASILILMTFSCKKSKTTTPITYNYNEVMDSLNIHFGEICLYESPFHGDTVIFNSDSTVTEKFYGNSTTLTRRISYKAQYSIFGYGYSFTPFAYPVFRIILFSDDTTNVDPNSFIAALGDTLLYVRGGFECDSVATEFEDGSTVRDLFFVH